MYESIVRLGPLSYRLMLISSPHLIRSFIGLIALLSPPLSHLVLILPPPQNHMQYLIHINKHMIEFLKVIRSVNGMVRGREGGVEPGTETADAV